MEAYPHRSKRGELASGGRKFVGHVMRWKHYMRDSLAGKQVTCVHVDLISNNLLSPIMSPEAGDPPPTTILLFLQSFVWLLSMNGLCKGLYIPFCFR